MSTLRNMVDLEPGRRVAPPPLLTARRLSVSTPRGPVFGPIDISLEAGTVTAVVGIPDSGKSTLLLALTGRMRGVSGELVVAGQDGVAHPRRVAKISAVARIADLVELEPALSIEDCITERGLAEAAPARSRLAEFLHASGLLGLEAPLGVSVGTLKPVDQTRLAIALACIRPADLLVLDDLDHGANLGEQEALWQGLLDLAETGVTIVASTSERESIPPTVNTFEMEPRHGA